MRGVRRIASGSSCQAAEIGDRTSLVPVVHHHNTRNTARSPRSRLASSCAVRAARGRRRSARGPGLDLVRHGVTIPEQATARRDGDVQGFRADASVGRQRHHDDGREPRLRQGLLLGDDHWPTFTRLGAAVGVEPGDPHLAAAHHRHQRSPCPSGQGSPGWRPSARSRASVSATKKSSAI